MNSAASCVDHTVRWEAAGEIAVTLPRAASSVPSIGTTVEYVLEDVDGNVVVDVLGVEQRGSTVTTLDGKVDVSFSFVPATSSIDNVMGLRVTLSKEPLPADVALEQQFLCGGEEIPCLAQGNLYSMKYLTFDTSILIVDNSSVPVQGQVVIGDTACALEGANVCLNVKSGSGSQDLSQTCVQTDFTGNFAIGAVIGTLASVEVVYEGHTFALLSADQLVLDQNGVNGEGTGFTVNADTDYTGLVFSDTSTTSIVVQVSGGACERYLGHSTVSYRIRGCPGFEHIFPTHASIRQTYTVYAQPVEVSAEVYGTEDLGAKVVDLTSQANSTLEQLGLDTDLDTENGTDIGERFFRFQYDGSIIVDIKSSNVAVPRCSSGLSFLSGNLVRLIIAIRETFPDKHVVGGFVPECTVFGEDARVITTNKLGVDLFDPLDKAFFDARRADGASNAELQLLQICSSPELDIGCTQELIYDTLSSPLGVSKANGRIEFVVLVGPPNTIPPHSKTFTAEFRRTPTSLGVQEVATAVVVGDYERGLIEALDVPIYEPVMILRDPPGGGSYASYTNMETTIELTHETFSHKSSSGGFNHSKEFIGAAIEFCVGELWSTCFQAVLGFQSEAASHQDSFVFDPATHRDKGHSIELTTTWSYTTSKSQWTAGQASDVFVIPSIKLALENVDEVYLDLACTPQVRSLKKFSGAEELTVSFLTYNDVIQFDFNETIEGLRNALDAEPTSEGKQNIQDAIDNANQAIVSWGRVVDQYLATNENASSGVGAIQPADFFLSSANIPSALSSKQYAGLLPKTLVDNAIPLPGNTGSNNDLDSINVITFTGGGSSLDLKLDHEAMSTD